MENIPVVGLLVKREEIARQIAELERQIHGHEADISQLDGTIGLFAPNVTQAKREATRFARSAHFVTGELSRRVRTALREADGRAVTVDEIAAQPMREKGPDMNDGELRADVTRRFLWTLNRMLRRGAVTKEGWGAAARWGAPAPALLVDTFEHPDGRVVVLEVPAAKELPVSFDGVARIRVGSATHHCILGASRDRLRIAGSKQKPCTLVRQ